MYSRKFSQVQTSEPSVVGSNIRVSMPPTNSEIWCVGVYPSFNFRVDWSALEKRELLHPTKI